MSDFSKAFRIIKVTTRSMLDIQELTPFKNIQIICIQNVSERMIGSRTNETANLAYTKEVCKTVLKPLSALGLFLFYILIYV